MNIKENIKQVIEKSLSKINVFDANIMLDVPSDKKNGDYATNVAMQVAGQLKKNARDIALEIVENIKDNKYIERIEVAGPGFINFFVNKKALFDIIGEVIKEGENYGRSDIGQNKKINVEFVSANPTGFLHLGHARGAAYGDSLCRILDFAGYDVKREYYINDDGNQINNLGKSIKARYRGLCGLSEDMPEDGYNGREIIDVAKKIYDEHKDSWLDEDIAKFKDFGIEILLNKIKQDLKDFRVEFDIWTSEKKIREKGRIEEAIAKLKEKEETYEAEGALWLKSTKYGDEKDRVLIKNDGEYAYITPDIANHLDKFDRGNEKVIDIFGADHHGYVPRLKAAVEALGYDSNKLEVKIIQMVRLFKGNEEIKMSKRTGKVVTMEDLIEEVGVNATRYYFAMRNIETQMDFDIDMAVKKAHDNPVYYVSYAHARICSLLKEKEVVKTSQFSTINNEYAYDILFKINEFKDIIEASAEKRLPHLITNYVYDLANLLHIYYNHEKILTDDDVYTNERLLLMKAIKIVIKNALSLIGVDAPNEM